VFSFNQQTKPMPRPPSELTGSTIQIAVRVTQPLKDEFKSLGGAMWLRKLLANAIEQRKNREAEFDKK
jgi:hypothetical protein